MYSKKFALIVTLLLLTLIGLLLAADKDDSMKSLTGKLRYDKTTLMLQTNGASYRLLLAPKAALDTLGIAIMADSTATVVGKLSGNILIAQTIRLGDKDYALRDAEMQPLWEQLSTYNVVPRTCIGCRLCVSNCPLGAITMTKGKAIIDQTKCVECGICTDGVNNFKGCPVKAINKK